MSRGRWIAAAVSVSIVAALLVWQQWRERQVSACVAHGRIWDGSRCVVPPGPPIIKRELERG